jgi:hypothetical protein
MRACSPRVRASSLEIVVSRLAGHPDHFINVVVAADTGEGTDGWKLDASAYSVDFR